MEQREEKQQSPPQPQPPPSNGLSSLFASFWCLTAKTENVTEIKDYLKGMMPYFKFFIDNSLNYELVRPILGIISNITANKDTWRLVTEGPFPVIDCVATFLTTRRELGGTTTTTATSDAVLEGLVAVQNLCAQEEEGVLFVLRDETILDTLFYLWGSCKRVGTKKGMEIQRSVQSIVEALEFAAIRRNISYPVERFHTILNKKKRFSLE